MLHRVFISYSRRDYDKIEEIRQALAGLALSGHLALFKDDRSIVAGEDWEQRLWDELDQADVVLACLSRHYFASRWCRVEFTDAFDRGVKVLPCVVSPCQVLDPRMKQRQFAMGGRSLSAAWGDEHTREEWLSDLVGELMRALDPTHEAPDPVGDDPLDAVDPELVASAWEMAGHFAPSDAVGALKALRRADPGAAREVLEQLASLTGETSIVAPIPPVSAPAKAAVAAEPPTDGDATSPWTRYWRTRLDRTTQWRTLTRDVASAEVSGGDHAYLVVGEPSQEPGLLVSRIRSFLPGSVDDEARRPAVIVVPFPDPTFVATDGFDVQRQFAMATCEHPEFPDLHPKPGPGQVVAEAARRRPLVFVLGSPLRRSAEAQIGAVERFFAGLEQLVGPPMGRWPVRIVAVVEEARGGSLHGRLLRAIRSAPVAFDPFPPLHFPPWEEVHEQLHDDDHFQGLDVRQLALARDDYNLALSEVESLTELAARLLATLDRLKES